MAEIDIAGGEQSHRGAVSVTGWEQEPSGSAHGEQGHSRMQGGRASHGRQGEATQEGHRWWRSSRCSWDGQYKAGDGSERRDGRIAYHARAGTPAASMRRCGGGLQPTDDSGLVLGGGKRGSEGKQTKEKKICSSSPTLPEPTPAVWRATTDGEGRCWPLRQGITLVGRRPAHLPIGACARLFLLPGSRSSNSTVQPRAIAATVQRAAARRCSAHLSPLEAKHQTSLSVASRTRCASSTISVRADVATVSHQNAAGALASFWSAPKPLSPSYFFLLFCALDPPRHGDASVRLHMIVPWPEMAHRR